MKVMLLTIPMESKPAVFPPFGALSVMNYARKRSQHTFNFYNLDYHRDSFDKALQHIVDYKPDVLGISAVVSTAYKYTKQLATEVKRLLPDTMVVVGGNLGASAELLLRRASVDLVAVGEGEITFLNVVNRAESTRKPADFTDVAGLMLLNGVGELVNTGYEAPLRPEEIWNVDWEDLKADGSIDYYFFPCSKPKDYRTRYAAAHPNHAAIAATPNARKGSLTIAKGCVARCTFCHRWDKGMRHIPVDEVMRRFERLYHDYGVREFSMVAETFGADKRWLNEFLDRIEPYKIVWYAGGVRASAVTPEFIQRMIQTGCTALVFGNETGSSRMLEIMEKKLSLEDNYNAAKWTVEAKLGNVIQLVIGMPGETPETIRETIEYVKFGTSITDEQNPRVISINYAQALPGTPLYEYARIHGLLGGTDLDSEERYLLSISDRPAGDPETFINFTDNSRLTVISWNLLIRIEANAHYVRKFGYRKYAEWFKPECPPNSRIFAHALRNALSSGSPGVLFFFYLLSGLRAGQLLAWYPVFFHHIRALTPTLALVRITQKHGLNVGWSLMKDLFRKRRARNAPVPTISLRKVVLSDKKEMKVDDGAAMIPLRAGR